MAAARFVVPNASFHSPNDVALIPLLQEFQITNDSPLIAQILLEQQLVDTLSLIPLKEKEAREKLKKDEAEAREEAKKNSSSKQDPQGSKKKSKKLVLSKEGKIAKEQAEMLLENILHAYRQAQGRLDAQAHQTQQAIVSQNNVKYPYYNILYSELWHSPSTVAVSDAASLIRSEGASSSF